MAKCHLNLEKACQFLQGMQVTRLDGVANAVSAKMEALEVKPNRKAHKAFPISAEEQLPGGNVRGLLRWIETADNGDAESLQVLEAVISARLRAAGRQPKPNKVEALTDGPLTTK